MNTEEMPGRATETDKPIISIDKEGNWFYNGLPIVNKAIYLFLNQQLERDEAGGYRLRRSEEIVPVLVEDTPFVVIDVALVTKPKDEDSSFLIRLNDETEEPLHLDSLTVGKDNVLYCEVKEGKFKARFLRPSYYRLAEHIIQEDEDRFYIPLNGRKYFIKFFTRP